MGATVGGLFVPLRSSEPTFYKQCQHAQCLQDVQVLHVGAKRTMVQKNIVTAQVHQHKTIKRLQATRDLVRPSSPPLFLASLAWRIFLVKSTNILNDH